MRILALDIGAVRVGIAICDPDQRVATPVCVLPAVEVRQCAKSFRRLLDDWEPELILCGLPYTLSGQEGPQAASIREFAAEVSQRSGLPIEFSDERLSSQQAKRSLREKGLSEKEMRGKVDMIAACIFLQTWIDKHTPHVEG